MSASARSSGGGGGSRREVDGEEKEKRRRSRSSDKLRSRRDSGNRARPTGEKEKERGGSSGASSPANTTEGEGRSGMKGSGRHHHNSSPSRVRRVKSEGGAAVLKPSMKDRSRSRSPTRTASGTATPAAPRIPQRCASETSDLSSALEATRLKHQKHDTIVKKDSFEEASLGDYKLYAQQKRFGTSRQKMGDIPEESLGSFTAFAKKYDEEKLLGLHDDDEGPDVYGQRSSSSKQSLQPQTTSQQQSQKTNKNDVSVSLGALMNMNPMSSALGSNTTNKASNNNNNTGPVEESLGSFAAFHTKYEQEELLGLHESTLSAAVQASENNIKPTTIPEESMGDFVQASAAAATKAEKSSRLDESRTSNNKARERKADTEAEEKEKDFPEIILPKNRIEKLGKRGGVGYRIMVDTPGGHLYQPMKIVVAIEFEDETDSDESEDEEEKDPLDNIAAFLNKLDANRDPAPRSNDSKEPFQDKATEMLGSGHLPLPLSALDEDKTTTDKPPHHKKKKQHRKSKSTDSLSLGKQQRLLTEDDDVDASESNDNVSPLAASLSRWNNQTPVATSGGSTPKQPLREKSGHSTSTHSAISSVTLDTALIRVQSDNCASHPHPHSLPRKPGSINRGRGTVTNESLRRPSGTVQAGGTAALLKRPSMVTPHNLGTRRGLLLRQQSEASMKSTGTSKSLEASSHHEETPDEYQASFMQLNLTDLEKTEMQTNEEVEQAELPEELRSGVEGIDESGNTEADTPPLQTTELETIPEGKDPKVAASELLGMKTMLKHIKRVAPMRSKSFEFDRDMPKQMWNKMFNKSRTGELAGSQYVDNDDSTSTAHEEDPKVESARRSSNQSTDEQQAEPSEVESGRRSSNQSNDEQQTEPSDRKSKGKGLFSTIKRVTSAGPSTSSKPADSSGSKGKSSLWGSTIGRVIPSTKEANPVEKAPEQTENANDEASEASLEIGAILQELDKSLAHNMDGSGFIEEPTPGGRRNSTGRGNDGSARGDRTRRADRRGGPARNRAARAQHAHNRSLRDTIDFYTAEQEDDDLPQLDAINADEAKKRTRVRARRRPPPRTKSADEGGMSRSARVRSGDGTRAGVDRTKSQDNSPVRPTREAVKRMHQSFSAVDPNDAPYRRQNSRDSSDMPFHRRRGSRDSVPNVSEAPFRRQGSRDNVPNKPHRARPEKGTRASVKIKRPQRKRSNGGVSDEAEAVAVKKGAELPQDATEEELREILDYH